MSLVFTDLIKEQAMQCLIMFGAGIAFMLVYQLCAFLIRPTALREGVRAALEIVFWLAAAVMISQFLYYCAYGRLSVHCVCAFAAGALLWKKCFCGIIHPTYCEGKRIRGLRKKHGKKEKEQSVQRQQPGN